MDLMDHPAFGKYTLIIYCEATAIETDLYKNKEQYTLSIKNNIFVISHVHKANRERSLS